MGRWSHARLLVPFLLLVAAAGCGAAGENSSPTAPSSASGGSATIAGTVSGAGASGMTVAVAGTTLSAGVESSGTFRLGGVPSGNVQLQFKQASMTATAQLSNVANDELIQIQVQAERRLGDHRERIPIGGEGRVVSPH